MKMRKWNGLLWLAAWFYPLAASAQFDEFGSFLGTSAYSGDLTERAVEPLEMNFAAGLYVRKKLNDQWGLKLNAYRGVISGDDAHATAESGLWERNLNFSTELYELGALLEYHLLKFETGHYQGAPYFFAGLSAFHFNPRTEMGGKTYDLHAYRTEGVEYSLLQFAVPFGAGMKLGINDHGSIGLELGLRKTFTDYLDDVSGTYPEAVAHADPAQRSLQSMLSYRSPEVLPGAAASPSPGQQRGNPGKADWYFFFGFTVGVYLRK